jgi:acyl-coenzyme A thioesterase PaaI-like protein
MSKEDDDETYIHEDEQYFRSIPWVAAYLDSPLYVRSQGISRFYKNDETTAHTLFSTTFKTPDTFVASLSLYKKPSDANGPITETLTFMSLGSGLNGHVDTAHGGVVATILDEVAGLMLRVGAAPEGERGAPIFTAYLNVNYRAPVRTPQVVVVAAWIRGVTGRKKMVSVEMRERDGRVLADAEALFVRARGGNL